MLTKEKYVQMHARAFLESRRSFYNRVQNCIASSLERDAWNIKEYEATRHKYIVVGHTENQELFKHIRQKNPDFDFYWDATSKEIHFLDPMTEEAALKACDGY